MAQNKDMKEKNDAPEAALQKSAVALREEETLAFWKHNGIFEKSLEKNKDGKELVFYDGPPFGTGQPHYGHIIPGTVKDVIPRFETMRGRLVKRKWGWDCHGLPVENLIEQDLGLKSKKDIVEYGIGKFNAAAKASVLKYADEWERIVPRTGRWVNMEDDYKTMDTSYTESVWWAFKTLHDKGLAYEGFKVMNYCPRCETTLSNFEVNQGYKDITDLSAYVKFKVAAPGKPLDGAYLVAWTTTPWTLPGNAALAVNPDIAYVSFTFKATAEVPSDGATYVVAKDRLAAISAKLKREADVVSEMKGSELAQLSYEPVFKHYKGSDLKNKANGWKTYAADFVTAEDGTGIVHIAPAFGADDYELSVRENLPFIQHVTPHGEFRKEVEGFAGQFVKPKDDHQKADIEMVKYLAHNGFLFDKEKIVHSYAHCWRCDTPLLNYATSSWFVKVTAIKDDLVKENSKVKWVPEHVKDGRFGKWLEGAKDWAVSRTRFWGAPLPVWKCKECEKVEVVSSIAELRAKKKPRNLYTVMRHGEAVSNVKEEVCSSLDNCGGLTEAGKKQAEAAGKKLASYGFDLVFVSPLERTRATAEIATAAAGISKDKVKTDDRLREIGFGAMNGRSIAEYKAYWNAAGDRFEGAPEGGESQAAVMKRVGGFIEDINSKYEGKKILIVTHDSPAWLLCAYAEGSGKEGAARLHKGKVFFLKNAETVGLSYVSLPRNEKGEIDLHRPFIDDYAYPCPCGGVFKRIPDVFDCWFESGSMPFAQHGYPHVHGSGFDPKGLPLIHNTKGYPADFIAEGLDQTRGWFYTLIVLGTALFGKSPYKSVIVNGLLLAEDGRKMSKRLKNYPELSYIVDKYGADALRYFLMSSPVVRAEDSAFSEKGVDEVYKKLVLRLENTVSFYELYKDPTLLDVDSDSVLDKWILARLSQTASDMTKALENREIDRGAWPLEAFIDDLSTWYVRRSRERLKGEDAKDKQAALSTFRRTLEGLATIMAPYMPFLAESVYGKVRKEGASESVHLSDWPTVSALSSSDERLLADMAATRKAVTSGLEARTKAKVNVRQPLGKLAIKVSLGPEFLALVKDEVNVKEIVIDPAMEGEAVLDTMLTPELKAEGQYREILRAVQDLRKKADLKPSDKVELSLATDAAGEALVRAWEGELKRLAGVISIRFGDTQGETVKAGELSFTLAVSKK